MKFQFPIFALVLFLTSCIGDDFVNDQTDPLVRITNPIDTIETNTTYQFKAMYLNNIGQEEIVVKNWTSSNTASVTIDNTGLAQAISTGSTTIRVEYEENNISVFDEITLEVGNSTVINSSEISGTIITTSSYALEGDFELITQDNGIQINISDNYKASTALPGLYIYLSNNRNSVANAFEVSKVAVFEGSHSYNITNVGINDFKFIVYFCKPFNVKVGEAAL